MKLSLRSPSALGRAFARVRGSPWWRPLTRVALAALALAALALVGIASARGGAASAASEPVVSSSPPLPPLLASTATPALAESAAAAPTASAAPEGTAARGPATPEDPVVLNEATIDDLERLPGIGQKRALAILALRARLGRFHQVEDLLRVKGLGPKALRRLRPLVRLDPPSVPDAGSP